MAATRPAVDYADGAEKGTTTTTTQREGRDGDREERSRRRLEI
jgi:hypothetical protein